MRKPAGPTAGWVIGILVSLNDLYLSPSFQLCASNRPWPLVYCLPVWAGGEGPCPLEREDAGQMCRGDRCRHGHSSSAKGQLVTVWSFVGHMASNEVMKLLGTVIEKKKLLTTGQQMMVALVTGSFPYKILKVEFSFVLFLRFSVESRLGSNPWSSCLSLSGAEITGHIPSHG